MAVAAHPINPENIRCIDCGAEVTVEQRVHWRSPDEERAAYRRTWGEDPPEEN